MDFDAYFDELDVVSNTKKDITELKCCDNIDNHMANEGLITCSICGNTINNIIDVPEWKNYDNGKNGTRCGMPVNTLLPKSSLGTIISNKNANNYRINMYQKWNSMPYKERSLYKIFNMIDDICNSNCLPPIIGTTSKSLYKIISETKISRGKNRQGIIAACVFNACKECNVPRSNKEIAAFFSIDPKIMTKGCKNFTEIFRMSKQRKKRIQSQKSITICDFIARFCSKLDLTEEDTNHILKLSDLCNNDTISNENTPPSMASGCILLYIKLVESNISKKQISDICKISEVTINKCYKKIIELESVQEYIKIHTLSS